MKNVTINPSKMNAIFAIIAGIFFIVYRIHYSFPASDPKIEYLLEVLLQSGLIISFIFWLTFCAWENRTQLKMTGWMAYVFSTISLFIIFYWAYVSDFSDLNSIFSLWKALGFSIGTWGILAFGTTLLVMGRYPRLAVVFLTVGFVMFFSGRGSWWTFRDYLAGIGLIWLGFDSWFGNASKREIKALPALKKNMDKGSRFISLDLLRGLIMCLMAIDHTSAAVTGNHPYEFFNRPVVVYDSVATFLTRFVTHFCAPGFFFLMGAGMILFANSRRKLNWTTGKIITSLMIRGILIIAMERVLWNPIIFGSLSLTNGGVLFGLGGSLILGALFIRLNSIGLLGAGITGVLLTQFLPQIVINAGIYPNALSGLFLLPKLGRIWFNLYPILPWLSISLIGMAFGNQMLTNKNKAFKNLLIAGLVSLGLFVVVRFGGSFGNFHQAVDFGFIGFLNLTKYPPDLVFTALTLGVIASVLYLFEKFEQKLIRVKKPLMVFGQTALFFYFIHWFYFLGIAKPFYRLTGNLAWVYAMWILGLILLYPLCRLYLNFKLKTAPESIWRFF